MSKKTQISGLQRPMPESSLLEDIEIRFAPAVDLAIWVSKVFIDPDGLIANPDHSHLIDADIGFLWTNAPNKRQGKLVAGTCEIPKPPNALSNKWHKARWEFQVTQWFGGVPDFLITLDANLWVQMNNPSACATIEHELYHAGQAEDEFGSPKFHKDTGSPIWTIKGHDVEEHIGVVRRYGTGAASANVTEFVEAAKGKPEIAAAKILGACGTCLRLNAA